MVEIPYAGQVSVQDFVRAQVLHCRPSQRGAVVRKVLLALSAVWLAVALVRLASAPFTWHAAWLALSWPPALVVALPLPWWYPRLIGRRV